MKKQIALFILILSLFGTAYGMAPNTSGGQEMPAQSLESSLSTFIAQQVSRSLEPINQKLIVIGKTLTVFGNRIGALEQAFTRLRPSAAPQAPSTSAAATAGTLTAPRPVSAFAPSATAATPPPPPPSRVHLQPQQILQQPNINTLLCRECLHGNLRNVTALVQRGARVNTHNNTPLYSAAFNGHLPVVQYLIEQRADRTARIITGPYAGKTALDVARARGHSAVVSYLESLDQSAAAVVPSATTAAAAASVSQAPRSVSAPSGSRPAPSAAAASVSQVHRPVPAPSISRTAPGASAAAVAAISIPRDQHQLVDQLVQACSEGDLGQVKNLIAHGAPIKVQRYRAQPLHKAVQNGRLAVVEYLVQNGADVNFKNSGGFTPLHWAAKKGYLPIVQCLVQNGADRTTRTTAHRSPHNNQTALELARSERHAAIVSYLESLDQPAPTTVPHAPSASAARAASAAAATTTAITREMTPEEQAACSVLQSLASQDRKRKADDQPSEASRDTKKSR